MLFIPIIAATLAITAGATLEGRTLSAATRPTNLRRRNQAFEFAHDVELFYAHENNGHSQQKYGATVRIASGSPILVLEETESWLSSIECSNDLIVLTKRDFMDSRHLANCHDLVDGHIITSHPSCNKPNERLAYRVLSVEEISETAVSLRISRASWKTAFDSVSVEMGYTDVDHGIRDHAALARKFKRQDNPTATFDLNTVVPSLTSTPTPVSVDASAPTATQLDVAATVLNQAVPLPSNSPIDLTCNECSTRGTIDLAWGQWDIDLTDSNDDDQRVTGYANITANGLGATINLGANIRQTYSFMQPVISTIQSASYRVPGLGGVAFGVGPFIAGGYTLNANISVSQYGFDVQIPDGATASVNLSGEDAIDIDASGFGNANVTAIPWNATAELDGLSAWLALRWTIQASFYFQDDAIDGIAGDFLDDASASAAVYLDTPILNMTLNRVQNVNADCQPSSDSTITGALQNVARIDLAAGWDYGAYLNADIGPIDIDPSYRQRGDDQLTLGNGANNLCLNWQDNHYVTAREAVAAATGSGSKSAVPFGLALGVGLATSYAVFAAL